MAVALKARAIASRVAETFILIMWLVIEDRLSCVERLRELCYADDDESKKVELRAVRIMYTQDIPRSYARFR